MRDRSGTKPSASIKATTNTVKSANEQASIAVAHLFHHAVDPASVLMYPSGPIVSFPPKKDEG